MKITTWNVNGLRAVLKKGSKDWMESHQADILCLQEIKTKPEQLTEDQQKIADYQITWNSAEKPGYSGVATLARIPLDEIRIGLGIEKFDTEGRVIRTRQAGFYLYNIYFPNGQRGQARVDYKLEFYASLLAECDQLIQAGEKIVITGDFNTAHNEIDLAHPKENQTTSGFLPEERVWIDYYIEHGFVDAYRFLYPDRVQYTWWTFITQARKRNIGWRLDYYMVSENMMSRVKDVLIHDDILGSDHCPVSILID